MPVRLALAKFADVLANQLGFKDDGIPLTDRYQSATSGRCWSSGGTGPNDQAAALGGFSLARIAAIRSDALYGRV